MLLGIFKRISGNPHAFNAGVDSVRWPRRAVVPDRDEMFESNIEAFDIFAYQNDIDIFVMSPGIMVRTGRTLA
jgi:hypothetical protein